MDYNPMFDQDLADDDDEEDDPVLNTRASGIDIPGTIITLLIFLAFYLGVACITYCR